ncbi:MAG: DUF533 domain-containing protein [Xanthomonadales bacterium]|nr:DUF533 domain-containing protein [Xanthomonadales bacterium]
MPSPPPCCATRACAASAARRPSATSPTRRSGTTAAAAPPSRPPPAQAASPPAAALAPPAPATVAAPSDERARSLLVAIVHAAKADGHIDATERATLDRALAEHGEDEALRRLVREELEKPTEPHAVAALARDEQHAAEIYLASLMTVGEIGFMERAYLDALASALRLPPELKATLEREVAAERLSASRGPARQPARARERTSTPRRGPPAVPPAGS